MRRLHILQIKFDLKMKRSICVDIRKEISQYSSKIALTLGETTIYTKLTKNVYLRFLKNRRQVDVYFDDGFYVCAKGHSDVKTQLSKDDVCQWQSCSLHYADSLFLLSNNPKETQNLLLLLRSLDVPFLFSEKITTRLLYQCDYKYSILSNSYVLYLVENHMRHKAVSADSSHPLYPFLAKKHFKQCREQILFLISVLLMSFIYLIGIRRLSVYSSPNYDFLLELSLSVWITGVVYFKL